MGGQGAGDQQLKAAGILLPFPTAASAWTEMPAYTQQTPLDFTAAAASGVQKQLQVAAAGAGAFDAAVADLLLQYLDEQVQGASVDIDADLALLKLFLIHPAKASADAVAKVLVKGVMALPSPFFTGATSMIPADLRDVRRQYA